MNSHRTTPYKYTLYIKRMARPLRIEALSLRGMALLIIGMMAAMLGSCGHGNTNTLTDHQRQQADSIAIAAKDLQGLDEICANARRGGGNTICQIAALREKGNRLREQNSVDKALEIHSEALKLAEKANDTIAQAQVMNSIGEDYRRMGILDMAQRYHYNSWLISKESGDSSCLTKANKVVSLKGLANIYLFINNILRADSALKMALGLEQEIHDLRSQADSYTQLGTIQLRLGNTDSAWICYHKALQLSKQSHNVADAAKCHLLLGNIRLDAQDYPHAIDEFQNAYDILQDDPSTDPLEQITPLASIAAANIETGNYPRAQDCLDRALHIAKHEHSIVHLAELYMLYYRLYKLQDNNRQALHYFELADVMQDSLADMHKVNRMQNASLDLERGIQDRRMMETTNKLKDEQTVRRTGYIVFLIILVLMAGIIGMLIYTRRLRTKSHNDFVRLSTMRDTFFRNVTHEFRTPLTVILGLGRELQNPQTSPAQAQDIGRSIERQGKHILRLINQLLDISKIKSALGSPDWRYGDVAAYIAMIVESYTDYANQREVRLQFISNPKNVDTDFVPDYVDKMIGNLLSNSLKYTPRYGRVDISLWRKERTIKIEVSDTGRGIPPESLPNIFQEFYQPHTQDNNIGTGLGLALVYQIVKRLGGTIKVDSTLGRGTTFHISLPIKRNSRAVSAQINTPAPRPAVKAEEIGAGIDNTAAQNAETASAPTATATERILVVEDDSGIAALIGRCLQDKYTVAYASSGKEGLEKARLLMPELIITDIRMPQMNGLEMSRTIRQDELISHIPIIALTARATDDDRVEGLKAGVDSYITKPFNSELLKARVESLLHQRARLRQKLAGTIDKDIAQSPSADYPIALSVSSLQDLSETDRQFLAKTVDSIYSILNTKHTLDVNSVAAALCMSYSQFNRKICALTGYTPAQYIQRIKIKKAQRMMRANPNMSLKEVAMRCGFSDYSNFVRAFKNVCSITPTQHTRQA